MNCGRVEQAAPLATWARWPKMLSAHPVSGSFHVKSPNGFNPYLFDFAENWYIERP